MVGFADRALRRLRFFPFTLLHAVLNALISIVQRRRGHLVVCVGKVAEKASMFLPGSVMLWLERVLRGPPGHQYYVCVRLPREAATPNLHEVFSVLLAFPRLRAVGLYWDAEGLADDLSLMQVKQDRDDPAGRATLYEDIDLPDVKHFEEFLQSGHMGIDLPVAVIRDAQTLLKRQTGRTPAVCLNMPAELHALASALVAARPDLWFFNLSPSMPAMKAINIQSLHDYGLNLHERMALVQAADAYIGSFDELGCAALIARRPAVLLGGGNGAQPDWISRVSRAVWFPDPAEPETLSKPVLQFFSDHLELSGR
jgi:hypothetical protein